MEKIANKLRKFNGILYKTRDYFSKRQLLMFYDAYAKSIIEYGILIYGSASKSDLETIHIIQKRILRTILRKKFCDWTQEEFILSRSSMQHIFLRKFLNQIRDNSPMKLLDLDEMHGVKTTRRTAANILPTISFKTKKKSLTRKLAIGYNFLMSNKIIPPNVKKITQPQFKSFFKNFTDNYIFDNRTIFDLLY